MFRGLYTAANGMIAKQNRIDTISNNLANVNTTGYKKDNHIVEAFSEKLLYKRNNAEGVLRKIPQRVTTNNVMLANGQEQLEAQITQGYFTLQDETGKGQYKSMSVARDENGYLRTVYRDYNSKEITKFGAYLLDTNGNRVQVQEGALNITAGGFLTVGGNPVSQVIMPEARKSIGTMNAGALSDMVMTNFEQGGLETTDNPMHIALQGDGFVKINMEGTNRIKYSRAGAFTMDRDGILRDYSGNTFVGINQTPVSVPVDARELEIKEDGSVYYRDENNVMQYADTLDVVDIENKEDLRKHGLSYYEPKIGENIREARFEGKVLQGYLEFSNVSGIDEMIQMIEAQRGFEADQKVIQAYDQIMNSAANEIGKL